MITKKQLNKAKVKVHFKSWALSVKKSTGLSFKIPEELIESLSPELDKYVETQLDSFQDKEEYRRLMDIE